VYHAPGGSLHPFDNLLAVRRSDPLQRPKGLGIHHGHRRRHGGVLKKLLAAGDWLGECPTSSIGVRPVAGTAPTGLRTGGSETVLLIDRG
jgi:hypothetical protein